MLKHLRRGQIYTGTMVEITSFGVTFVDIGGFTAMINIPSPLGGLCDTPPTSLPLDKRSLL